MELVAVASRAPCLSRAASEIFDTPAYWGARCRWQIAILASIGFDFLRLPVGPASLYNQAQPGVLIPAALAALDTVSPIGFACLP